MEKKRNYTIRTFLNDIHLWMGLTSGIIIFLVCLSGTILTYDKEIKSIFAEKLSVEPVGEKIGIQDLTTTLRANTSGTIARVTIPTNNNLPYEFSVKKDPKDRRGSTFLVNPYTQEILEPQKTAIDDFMLVMFKMHRWLLLDTQIGRPIVGVATIIFLLLSVSGIVLWFPKKLKWRNLKQGLKIKTNAKWKRINHDVHNTLGFYSCVFILIMGITGLCWSFESYRDGLSFIMGTKIFGARDEMPKSIIKANTSDSEINYDEAIEIANATFPYSGEISISFPSIENKMYSIKKINDSKWSTVASDEVIIDLYGTILQKKLYDDIPLNKKIASAIKPIHTGEIFGSISKFLYFLACLIATSLPVTGTIIWWNKLKKNKKWYLS